MLKILQARLQQYMNYELPDVQVGFRKGRGTRDQIANIHWIIRKAREFQKNYFYFCFIDYTNTFGCMLLLLLSHFSCVRLCVTYRQQPTRLPSLWDFPGMKTGVGCYFFLQCVKVKSEREVTQSCPTLSDPMDCSTADSSIHGSFQARILE